MTDSLYLDFFAIGALIPTVFVFFVAFLLSQIQQKSGATRWLLVFALSYTAFMLPYFPAATYYNPLAAYHRWFTVGFILLTFACLAQFFFHLPENTHPRLARGVLIAQSIVALIVSAFFFVRTYGGPTVYHFDGHYWDFDADAISRVVALFILLYLVIFITTGVFRVIIAKGGQRLMIVGLLLSFLLCTIPPTVTNILSRDGALDRGAHQTVIVACNVAGFFAAIVIFLNTTSDRTTFMAKIVGISLITFLTVFQGLNYFIFSEKESEYDALHRKDAELILSTGYRPADFSYAVAWDARNKQATPILGTAAPAGLDRYRVDAMNTAVLERIRRIDAPNRDEQLDDIRKVTAHAHREFAGYAGLILDIAGRMGQEETDVAGFVTKGAAAHRRKILFRYNKLLQVPDASFRAGLQKFCASQPTWFAPFSAAMLADAQAHPALNGAALKHEVARYLRPLDPAGTRQYRKTEAGNNAGQHYVAFQRADRRGIVEIGYAYTAYRAFIHPAALKLTGLLIAVVLVVVLGFRFFFLGSLVTPLNALLAGVDRVNSGDLAVRVPIKVEDEIGILSRSFNGMVASISEARERLQEYAEGLEDKVQTRTAELTTTLGQVQELKKQQDGDYFLTSLLIKPLAANHARSETIQVEFLVQQKKKFQFRKWDSEIGGDICMANNVTLRGKPYTVFLNADAMGKSMQGAGGALVLGSVFESIVERTQLVESMQDYSPERWIKNAFIELHKVFESFEGSMLISLITGLVDDATGLLYYINAEHPWTVLYRNGQARFIEEELMLRKLGTQGMAGGVSVQIFQLEAGDVLVAGSDGRDDILVGTTEDGERIINEDEHSFLKHVETAHGSLQNIKKALEAVGELTDDLSLVRVSFREVGKAARTNEDRVIGLLQRARTAMGLDHYEEALPLLNDALALDRSATDVIQELIRIHYNQQDFKKASEYADDYIDLRPAESEILYLAAVCHRRADNPARALDLAERLRLREPKRIEVLGLLAEIQAELGNDQRATAILASAREINADHSAVRRAAEFLESLRGSQV